MPVSVAAGEMICNPGTVVLTPGFQADALLTSFAGPSGSNIRHGLGIVDCATFDQACIARYNQNGQLSSNVLRYSQFGDSVVTASANGSSLLVQGRVTARDATTLTYTLDETNSNTRCDWLAIGGLLDQDCRKILSPTTTTPPTTVNLGWEPDLLVVLSQGLAAPTTTYLGNEAFSAGWVTKTGQCGICNAEATGQTGGTSYIRGSDVDALTAHFNNADFLVGAFAITATGYTITWKTVAGSQRDVYVLALRGLGVDLRHVKEPSVTGDEDYTTPFDPLALWLLNNRVQTLETIEAGSTGFSSGLITSTHDQSKWSQNFSGNGTTSCETEYVLDSGQRKGSNPGTSNLAEANTVTLGTGKFTINWNPVTGSTYWPMLALGEPATGVIELAGDLDVSVDITGTLTNVKALEGATDLSVTPAGTLTNIKPMAGDLTANVEITGTLTNIPGGVVPLEGDLEANVTPTGTLTNVKAMAGDLTANVEITGTLTNTPPGVIELAGTLPISVETTGDLTSTGAILLAGNLTVSLEITGFLQPPPGVDNKAGAVFQQDLDYGVWAKEIHATNASGASMPIDNIPTGSAVSIFGRVGFASSGIPYKQADLSTIEYLIFDHTNDDELIAQDFLDKVNVIFDTLQKPGDAGPDVTDHPWRIDDIGYNFRATFIGSNFTVQDHWYEIRVNFANVNGNVTSDRWRFKALHNP